MSQTERLMAIIDKLCQRNGKLNTAWIAREYEISDRQARRDIEYVRDRIISSCFGSSVDLVYDRANNEYKLTGSQAELEKLFAKSVISSAVAASAVNPLKDIIGTEEKELSSMKRVRFISQAYEMPDYTVFTKLMNAIEEGVRIEIEYKSLQKADSIRIIEPLELINYSAIWYLRAYDIEKKELRTFSLSRIKRINMLDEKREFKDYEALKKSDSSGYGIFLADSVERYTMRFHNLVAWIVSNQVWHNDQKGKWLDDNTYELTVPASDSTELVAKVLSYGADAEPISPKAFVERYNSEVSRLFNKLNKN